MNSIINKFRILEGLSLLQEDDHLNYLAFKQAKWMARRNWINAYNSILINLIAVGDTEDAVIRQWINQPDTRKIMFSDWTKIGSGHFRSKTGIIYWCCFFT